MSLGSVSECENSEHSCADHRPTGNHDDDPRVARQWAWAIDHMEKCARKERENAMEAEKTRAQPASQPHHTPGTVDGVLRHLKIWITLLLSTVGFCMHGVSMLSVRGK